MPDNARHHHVEHDDVEFAASRQLQRLLAVRGFLHLKTAAHEPPGHRFAEIGVVVNQQQVDLLGSTAMVLSSMFGRSRLSLNVLTSGNNLAMAVPATTYLLGT